VLEYYVKQYSRHGIHPTCKSIHTYQPTTWLTSTVNWYRQRRTNWEEDQTLLDKKTIQQPVLFIQATYDSVLKPEMSKSMDSLIPRLTRGEVAATHWALTQKPADVNLIIRQWLEKEGLVAAKSAL
jgi:pimeloyl-ACP methyl ester carboxylesterase